MGWTDDPIGDFDRRDREEAEWLGSRPTCAVCGHPIQDEHFYFINDEAICQECLDRDYRVRTEDYLE